MKCTEFERIAQQLMDQRQPLDSEPQLVSHVEECTTCASRFEQFQRLEDVVLSLYGLPPLHGEHRLDNETSVSMNHSETYWKSHVSIWRGSVATAAVVLMFSVWLAWPLGHVSTGPMTSFFDGAKIDVRTGVPLAEWPGVQKPLATERQFGDMSSAPDWTSVVRVDSESVAVLRHCYRLTSELPGVRTLEGTVNAAWVLLMKRIIEPSSMDSPPAQSPIGPHSSFYNHMCGSEFI